MYTSDCSKNIIQVQNPPEPPKNPCLTNIGGFEKGDVNVKLDLRLGRLDNSLKYKYFDNFWVGDSFAELNERYTVCLAAQSSLERLHSLVEVAEHWTGPISVSVFAAGDDELNILLLYITYLRQCQSNIRDRVSFHLALPRSRVPRSIDVDIEQISTMDCNRPEVTLRQMVKHISSDTTRWKNKNAYPQNHMRNLARKNCQTKYVYLTDIDIIPSFKQADELSRFLQINECKKRCAYVIPTYELDERVVFPANKTDLLRLSNKGLARPFHQKVFIFNQFATNFSK
ncbi:beta-14-glucuronyltransferase 1 [Holotrichia oblita]|uniref:Beta-14-glucuronyltransferase 1 n=2 Tax=Holotrichia oblita TaxID=644536 RepID=A0ACB9SYI1_HOLOL|nr:beta-14-glucuronyltransferase 1 [Holotrichia oblita]KAI4459631.1 beta-14-glucuronyltransferase 1 [Holotrichia oblita]